MAEKIKVINMEDCPVGIISEDTRFRRNIAPNGFVMIDKETFAEIMWEPGIKYMIDHGIIYIEDMAIKKELGIEPDDATEPVNVIVLNDKEKRAMMVTYTMEKFDETLKKISIDQIRSLAEFAIKNRLADYDKCEKLRQICGKDVVKAIRLGDQDKEPMTEEDNK